MTESNDRLLIQLVRDLSKRMDDNHREVVTELKETQKAVDVRLDAVERKLEEHQHHFQTISTVIKWAVPSGGAALAALWALVVPHK